MRPTRPALCDCRGSIAPAQAYSTCPHRSPLGRAPECPRRGPAGGSRPAVWRWQQRYADVGCRRAAARQDVPTWHATPFDRNGGRENRRATVVSHRTPRRHRHTQRVRQLLRRCRIRTKLNRNRCSGACHRKRLANFSSSELGGRPLPPPTRPLPPESSPLSPLTTMTSACSSQAQPSWREECIPELLT